MEEYEATFEIDSKSDAYAVERLMDTLYNSVREESRTLREDTSDSSATLAQFEALRDAARQPSPGRLTIRYERAEDGFES